MGFPRAHLALSRHHPTPRRNLCQLKIMTMAVVIPIDKSFNLQTLSKSQPDNNSTLPNQQRERRIILEHQQRISSKQGQSGLPARPRSTKLASPRSCPAWSLSTSERGRASRYFMAYDISTKVTDSCRHSSKGVHEGYGFLQILCQGMA